MRRARRFYQTCLDTKSIDSAGAEPFLALVQKVSYQEAHSDEGKTSNESHNCPNKEAASEVYSNFLMDLENVPSWFS